MGIQVAGDAMDMNEVYLEGVWCRKGKGLGDPEEPWHFLDRQGEGNPQREPYVVQSDPWEEKWSPTHGSVRSPGSQRRRLSGRERSNVQSQKKKKKKRREWSIESSTAERTTQAEAGAVLMGV